MTGRHEAPWVPDTTPGYQGQHAAPIASSEEAEAMMGYRLCGDCRTHHFRAYPEFPDEPCMIGGCQCWCSR